GRGGSGGAPPPVWTGLGAPTSRRPRGSWRPGCGPGPCCHTPGTAPDMTNHDDDDGDHDDRPLTQDELRHQKVQDRLMAELREVEEKLGHRVDLLATGEWIT